MLFHKVIPLTILSSIASIVVSEAATSSRFYSTIEPDATEIYKTQETANTIQDSSNVSGKAFDRFFIIWLENTDFDKAAESEGLSWLAEHGIVLDNYWAVTHPSEPNYIASVSGDYFALDDDRFIQMPKNVSTVMDLLDSKNISWGEYQQHLPYSGYQGYNFSNQENFANDYMRKHNPLMSFQSVTEDDENLSKIKNFTEFEKDLKNHELPQWAFITPNMTNDGHDSNINVAATWSKDFLEPLLENEYFMNNTLVLLTFDETDNYAIQNKVFSILLGGAVPDELKGTVDSTFYDHYSELSSVQANWDLPNLGRHDASANVFQIVANKTGITNKEVDTEFLVNNHTYVGYLNDDTVELPAPNVSAIGMNGKGVLDSIKSKWSDTYEKQVSDGYFSSATTTLVTGSIPDAVTKVTGTLSSVIDAVLSSAATLTGTVDSKNGSTVSESGSGSVSGSGASSTGDSSSSSKGMGIVMTSGAGLSTVLALGLALLI